MSNSTSVWQKLNSKHLFELEGIQCNMLNLESSDKDVAARVKKDLENDLHRKFLPICLVFCLYNFFRVLKSLFKRDEKIKTMLPVAITFVILLLWFVLDRKKRKYCQYLVFLNLLKIYSYQSMCANNWIDEKYQTNAEDHAISSESLIYGLLLFVFLNASTFKTTLVLLPLIVLPLSFLTFRGIKDKAPERDVVTVYLKFLSYFAITLSQQYLFAYTKLQNAIIIQNQLSTHEKMLRFFRKS